MKRLFLALTALLFSSSAFAQISVTVNGQTYSCSGSAEPTVVQTITQCVGGHMGMQLVMAAVMSDGSTKTLSVLRSFGSPGSWTSTDEENCQREASRRR